jgi:hypothetical protein
MKRVHLTMRLVLQAVIFVMLIVGCRYDKFDETMFKNLDMMAKIKHILILMTVMSLKLTLAFSQQQDVLRKIKYSVQVVSNSCPSLLSTTMFCYKNKVLSVENMNETTVNSKNEFIGYQFDKRIGLYFSAEKSYELAVGNVASLEQSLFFDIIDSNLYSVQKNNGKIIETYIPIRKKCDSSADTIYVHYSDNFKGICFSFAEKLEVIKGNKISKIELIHSSKKKSQRMVFEISEIPITEEKDKILKLFKELDDFYLSQK